MSRRMGGWTAVVVAAGCIAGLCATQAAAPHRAAAKEEKRVRLSDTRLRDALNRAIDFPGIDDPKTSLVEALDQFAKLYRVTFDIKDAAFKYEMLNDVAKVEVANPSPIAPMKVTLATVLRKILARVPVPSAATFLIRKDVIEITTESAVRRELGLPERKTEEDKPKQYDPTTLIWDEFRSEPLDDALAQIAESADTTILIDPRCGTKASTKIDATLRNVPVETAVELLAEMGGLAVVKRANAFLVTTPERAKELGREGKK